MLLTLLAVFLGSDLSALGSDEWKARDAASRRLAGTTRGAMVGLVASRSTDPEVAMRGRTLGRRWPGWADVSAVAFLSQSGPCTVDESDAWFFSHACGSIRRVAGWLGLSVTDGYDWVHLSPCKSDDERIVFSFWIDDLRLRVAEAARR